MRLDIQRQWELGLIFLVVFFLGLMGQLNKAHGAPDFERLADAIYRAEGGANTRHPYGILAKYKTTTPRQACINTCKHAWRDFSGQEKDFLVFLAARYAPIGAANDPKGLNQNWLRNVQKFYTKPLDNHR